MDVTADFSSEQASRLSLVPVQRLQEWERTGFLTASIPAKRRGVSRRYTFRDVIALRVATELRESGVSLQMLRRVVDYLRGREGLSATEALARTNLVTSGEQVYEVAGDVTLHLPSGQRMMVHVTIPLDQVVREVQRKARALRRAA
ncbi:MAG: MerR family transcriptional regulator [Polyangiaceae bacterium]